MWFLSVNFMDNNTHSQSQNAKCSWKQTKKTKELLWQRLENSFPPAARDYELKVT